MVSVCAVNKIRQVAHQVHGVISSSTWLRIALPTCWSKTEDAMQCNRALGPTGLWVQKPAWQRLLLSQETAPAVPYLAKGVDREVFLLLVLPLVQPDHLHINWQAVHSADRWQVVCHVCLPVRGTAVL